MRRWLELCLIVSAVAWVCNIIAYFVGCADRFLRKCPIQNDLQKFLCRESCDYSSLQAGYPLYSCQLRFHDHHVQCPADFHRQSEEHLALFIGFIKIVHPAHVALGKACAVRVTRLQKLCSCDRRTLLQALADGLADGIGLNHLRKILHENCGQFSVHHAVIHRFSDVYVFSFRAGTHYIFHRFVNSLLGCALLCPDSFYSILKIQESFAILKCSREMSKTLLAFAAQYDSAGNDRFTFIER